MTTFLSHFTLHLPWCPVKFQMLQQKIGEKNPLHFAVSLLDNFLNSEFWLFSILSGRQLDHPSHADSLSERGPCQKRGAGTPFGIGLPALYEVMQFAFKCNQHGNPQETPPHILVTNMQHSNVLQFGRKEEKKNLDFAVTFFFFFLYNDEFFALPFLAAGYRGLACYLQFGSFPDPWHCCSIPAEPQKPELARPEVPPPQPSTPRAAGSLPPQLQADLPAALQDR